MRDRHKHYDVIIAWAAGSDIEYKSNVTGEWHAVTSPVPMWNEGLEFRVVEPEEYCKEDCKEDYEETSIVHGQCGYAFYFDHALGNTVYCPFGGKIKTGAITGVSKHIRCYNVPPKTIATTYTIQGIDRAIEENQIFSTKEEAAEFIKQKALKS